MELLTKIYIAFGEDEGSEQECLISYDESMATTEGDGRAVPAELEISAVHIFNNDEPVDLLPALSGQPALMDGIRSHVNKELEAAQEDLPVLTP